MVVIQFWMEFIVILWSFKRGPQCVADYTANDNEDDNQYDVATTDSETFVLGLVWSWPMDRLDIILFVLTVRVGF